MTKNKRSYFNKIIRNFIIILCVPISAILLIYAHADQVVKEQVLEGSGQRFDIYYEQIEGLIKSTKETCLSVYSNEDCQMYSLQTAVNLGEDVIRKDVRQFLNNLTDVKYHDVFVYYNRDGKCVSGNNVSMTAERYYDTYYGDIGRSEYMEEFMNVLKTEVRRPMCYVIHDYTGKSYLCMTMAKRDSRNPAENYTVCVVLSPEYLNDITKGIDEENAFVVYNEEYHRILWKNLEGVMWDDMGLISNEVVYDTWEQQRDYMIQVRQSSQSANKYVYIVSSDSFWDELWQLRVSCFIGIFACVLVSIFIALKSARRIYIPIGSMVNYIQKQEPVKWKGKADKEFSDIMSYIQDKEIRVREYNRVSREWFLFDWLEGKIDDVNEEVLAKNNIFLPHNRFMICIIQLESANGRKDELYRFIVQNVIEELLENTGETCFAAVSKTKCVMLLDTEADLAVVEGIIREGQQFLQTHFQFALTIGFSNFHEDLSEMADCYREAQEALRYRFIAGEGKHIFYKDICGRSNITPGKGGEHIYMHLLDYVENVEDSDDTEQLIKKLKDICGADESISIDVVLMFRNQIIHALTRIVKAKDDDSEHCEQMIRELKRADTMKEFWERLGGYIAEIRCRRAERMTGEDVCAKAKAYIDANYMNNQLSVTMIGKMVDIQSGYLSKLFKEAYNISMLEYIAETRIKRAKLLLKEEDLSVAEIAEQVGFVNSHTFIRSFKKSENLTPGKYRELNKI